MKSFIYYVIVPELPQSFTVKYRIEAPRRLYLNHWGRWNPEKTDLFRTFDEKANLVVFNILTDWASSNTEQSGVVHYEMEEINLVSYLKLNKFVDEFIKGFSQAIENHR